MYVSKVHFTTKSTLDRYVKFNARAFHVIAAQGDLNVLHRYYSEKADFLRQNAALRPSKLLSDCKLRYACRNCHSMDVNYYQNYSKLFIDAEAALLAHYNFAILSCLAQIRRSLLQQFQA